MSSRHADVYFAAGSGLEETRHVFLAGNDLPAAWQNRTAFTIGETGFGTGLNFLAAWQLWRRTAPPGGRLHYISVEGFPLRPADLARALEPFAELGPLAHRLRAAYPHLYGGFHRIHFDDDRVTLTLLFGEAGDMLDALDARVDAWFLDGFAPARNPDLWRPDVLKRIAALTRPGGTAASFTVAGAVRRDMEAAGFKAEKAPGFGRKRHMLRARYTGDAHSDTGLPLRYGLPAHPPRTALVIGAGLAGSAVARALARRNVEVTIIDPDPDLVMAASGNPFGISNPKPTADSSPAGRFHCAAFDYAARHVFREAPDLFTPCGVLELAINTQTQRRFESLASGKVLPAAALTALSAADASQAAGIAIPSPALHFPEGGLGRPREYAAWQRRGIRLLCGRVASLKSSESGWQAQVDGGAHLSAEIAVIACANDSPAFGLTSGIPFTASRGQLSLVPATDESASLGIVITFGGYVSPALDGRHALGATYDDTAWPPHPEAYQPRRTDHELNHRSLLTALPHFPIEPPDAHWGARVAFRCTTPDRLPVCGPVPADLTLRAPGQSVQPTLPTDRQLHRPYKDGLYLCAGLGSRGLTTAPLLGELLASCACGDPMPTERVVTDLLHPARFFLRARRKAGFPSHS